MIYLSIAGTRPQLIKASVVSTAFSLVHDQNLQHYVVDTSQHYDYSLADFFKKQLFPTKDHDKIETLELTFNSEISFIASCLSQLELKIKEIKPSVIISYGDTNSTICACIIANRFNIPLAHVEAGVRDRSHIRPEEMNRLIADTMSDILFAPTITAFQNAKDEFSGPYSKEIVFTGDVMRDLYINNSDKFIKPRLEFEIKSTFVLVTLHRQENVDNEEYLSNIISALNALSLEVQIIFPIHPRTLKMIKKFKLELSFNVCEPQDYFAFQWLLENSLYVITDSGGLQKDASFAKKRSLVIYQGETGWTELVENGFLEIVDPGDSNLKLKMLDFDYGACINMDNLDHVFGKGDAGEKIVKKLISHYR